MSRIKYFSSLKLAVMLRDLFDRDPRSKQELRLLIQDLTSRVADDALRLSALQDGHVKELAKVEKLRKNL